MADQELRIKVAAETGAAQDALGKLSDEMAGLATTTRGAGGDLKDLHKQTAATTAQVNAAKEAIDRAKRAQAEANEIARQFGKESREAAEALARLKVAEEAATKATREAERAIEANAKAIGEAAKAANGVSPELKRMGDSLQRTGKEAEKAAGDLRVLEVRASAAGKASAGLSASWASFKGNLAANAISHLAGGIKDAGLYALDTASNFERMKTALSTTLGSTEAANKEFERLQQFAAATPFSLEEVTQGFLKLKNRGLDASEKAMRAYGDTAGAMGKTLDDVVEAVADATQGEGERLKEFGINMHKAGDKVSLTFRGVTQTVKFEAAEIEKYLIQLGETNFAGGMEAQSKTLGGLWSTLKDGLDQFIVGVMDSGVVDALKSIMGSLSSMSETGRFLGDVLGDFLGAAFYVLAGAVKAGSLALEAFSWGLNKLYEPVRLLRAGIEELAGLIGDELTRAQQEYNAAHAEATEALTTSPMATGEEKGWLVDIVHLTGQHALALTEVAIAHGQAAYAAAQQAKAEDALYEKLQKKIDKEEEKAIEDAFFESQQVGPRLKDGSFTHKVKPKKGKKKKDLRDEQWAFDRSVEDFASEQNRAVGAKAFEQEQAARERSISSMEAEIKLLDAKAERERTQVDMILFTADVESQAAEQRNRLIDEQLRREGELAKWEVKNAKTKEQREKAISHVYEVEGKKRALAVEREVKAEEREHHRRQQIVERVTGAVTTLGEGMVGAFERMAAGEKGAMASMLTDLLKGVAKKHAILGLGELAQGVGAQATTWGIPNPASVEHFTAAGMHFGVAAAAGIGAGAAGAIAHERRGGGGGASGGGGSGGGFARPGGSTGGGAGGGSGGDDGLDAQEVPVSHEQLRRGDPSVGTRSRSGGSAPVNINISGVNMYGSGGKEEFQNLVMKAVKHAQRGGDRARL